MDKVIKGKALVLGNNIDTDLICPGRYLELTDHKEIGSHCLAGVSEDIAPNFPKGGIIVAGTNFGCGSSREHAAIAVLNMGTGAIIADSFARIFYRNAINLGVPLMVCKGAAAAAKDGYSLSADIENGTVRIEETGEELKAEPITGKAMEILEAGGIKPLMAAKHKA